MYQITSLFEQLLGLSHIHMPIALLLNPRMRILVYLNPVFRSNL